MPYWLETDTFADDPVFGVLAGGKLAVEDALRASHCNLKAKASLVKKDGYLTKAIALEACRGRRKILDLLCTPALEQQPLVHRQGDECPCLGDKWIDGYDLRIHEFLKRNPSKSEYDLERAKRKDGRNTPLRAMVYARDGGCCRYCRSGPLHPKAGKSLDRRKALQYDHVDPEQEAGPVGANYAIACGACNEYKGQRTPYEAGMVLLPAPSPQQAQEWLKRRLELNDRPEYDPGDLVHITDASATDQPQITDRDSETVKDRDHEPGSETNATTTPDPAREQAEQQAEQPQQRPGNPLGSGRVGPAGGGETRPRPTLPIRESEHPDIYTRRARLPDYIWPPGTTPHRPTQQPPPAHQEE